MCPLNENPGLVLGTILGVAATQGDRQADADRLARHPRSRRLARAARLPSPPARRGRGSSPSIAKRVGAPSVYGDDRVFAYLRLEEAPDAAQDAAVAALEKAGKPVVTIRVATKYDLGEEFVRWEIATAIAGAVIGINPFNQPDVEASKIATKSLTSEYEKTGKLPSGDAVLRGRWRQALCRREERRRAQECRGRLAVA